MGASGEISSITFDGSDVVYVLLMNESFLNIDALKENPDAMKSAVTVMFGNPQGSIKEMLDLVVGTDSGIKFIYKGKTSGNEVECYLTTQDLKDILNGGGASADSSDEKKLEEQVKMTNVSCPMQVDEATMLNKLTIESDKVLYPVSYTHLRNCTLWTLPICGVPIFLWVGVMILAGCSSCWTAAGITLPVNISADTLPMKLLSSCSAI